MRRLHLLALSCLLLSATLFAAGCSEAPVASTDPVPSGSTDLAVSPRIRTITTDGLILYGADLNDAGSVSFVAHTIAAPYFYTFNAYLVRRNGERAISPDLSQACGLVEYMTMQALDDLGRMMILSQRGVPQATCQSSFLWNQVAGFRALAPLAGGVVSEGSSMNRFGWVSGVSKGQAHNTKGMVAAVWSPTGQPIDIGTIAGYPRCANIDQCEVYSWAGPINDLGVVLAFGARVLPDGTTEQKAYLWSAWGGATPIGSLDPMKFSSERIVMNSLGTVVGTKLPPDQNQSWLWNARRGLVSLPFKVQAINELGIVVGYDETGAVARRLTGEIVRLGSGRALAINNVGEVLVQHELGGPLEVWSGY